MIPRIKSNLSCTHYVQLFHDDHRKTHQILEATSQKSRKTQQQRSNQFEHSHSENRLQGPHLVCGSRVFRVRPNQDGSSIRRLPIHEIQHLVWVELIEKLNTSLRQCLHGPSIERDCWSRVLASDTRFDGVVGVVLVLLKSYAGRC